MYVICEGCKANFGSPDRIAVLTSSASGVLRFIQLILVVTKGLSLSNTHCDSTIFPPWLMSFLVELGGRGGTSIVKLSVFWTCWHIWPFVSFCRTCCPGAPPSAVLLHDTQCVPSCEIGLFIFGLHPVSTIST